MHLHSCKRTQCACTTIHAQTCYTQTCMYRCSLTYTGIVYCVVGWLDIQFRSYVQYDADSNNKCCLVKNILHLIHELAFFFLDMLNHSVLKYETSITLSWFCVWDSALSGMHLQFCCVTYAPFNVICKIIKIFPLIFKDSCLFYL